VMQSQHFHSLPMTRSDKRLVIASVLVGAPALAFWSRSRYPDLNRKAAVESSRSCTRRRMARRMSVIALHLFAVNESGRRSEHLTHLSVCIPNCAVVPRARQ
jgi:hypothetical protein